MRRFLLAAAALLAFAAPEMLAHDDDWAPFGRGRGRDRDRDREVGRYGYSGGMRNIVDRTLSDLRRAAQRNYVDGHERRHFERAMNELREFRYRQDYGRLSRVIEDLEHLVNADQVHPSDRRALAFDLAALRRMRY